MLCEDPLCQPHLMQGKVEGGFGTNEFEWTGTVENRNEAIPGSGISMHGYVLT